MDSMHKAFCAVVVLVLIGTLFSQTRAHASISGINTPVTSIGSIIFDDTFSSTPPPGITNSGPVVTPWTGATVTLAPTTDPNTLDFATASLDATFGGNNYAINFSNVTLTQAVGNTGTANLIFTFNVEYQLDAAGLPFQPTLYPNFVVNGTVQSTSGSFAAVSGAINYSGVNTAGTISTFETVNYNSVWNTPGPFSGLAVGVPTFGNTPVLVGNTTLTLDGVIVFAVDPASINAFSITVPEPASILVMSGVLGLALVRPRRAHRRQVRAAADLDVPA